MSAVGGILPLGSLPQIVRKQRPDGVWVFKYSDEPDTAWRTQIKQRPDDFTVKPRAVNDILQSHKYGMVVPTYDPIVGRYSVGAYGPTTDEEKKILREMPWDQLKPHVERYLEQHKDDKPSEIDRFAKWLEDIRNNQEELDRKKSEAARLASNRRYDEIHKTVAGEFGWSTFPCGHQVQAFGVTAKHLARLVTNNPDQKKFDCPIGGPKNCRLMTRKEICESLKIKE